MDSLDKIWEQVLESFKITLNDDKAFIIFRDLSLISLQNNIALITTSSDLYIMMAKNYKTEIEEILNRIVEGNYTIQFINERELINNEQEEEKKPEIVFEDRLIENFTFDSFVVGSSNKIAHSACVAVSESPGKSVYNPLFIYGNSGLGKTHLINSVGNQVKKYHPEYKILYLSAVDFVNEYVDSIKTGNIDYFQEKYRLMDLLLIDDIQFLVGKEKSNEIFFHIFNNMTNNNKQIVITSDRLPQELDGLENRLISRFSYGMRVGIDTPEFETALAILKKKIELQSFNSNMIDEEVLSYMASNFAKDVRELEGTLNRLIFESILEKVDHIDMKFALKSFKDDIQVHQVKDQLTTETIIKTVANFYNLTPTQLISKSRTANIALARHMAMFLIRDLLDASFVSIGEAFGGRDHSTVMKACDKVEENKKTDQNYQIAISELKKILI
ncbi:chromosomal replication initiator protein DnaA [Beduini massiliensis]|uniref:chromosomal replication initiator protein DnaA n=1 Tax=Beduini massiliensis TaxID=1585974 RepID=UPI00059A94FB|nr:chromosomal replication initiator protein DnaA [Beduini massiliensis]